MSEIKNIEKQFIVLARTISQWLMELMALFAMPKVFKTQRNIVFLTRDQKVLKLDIFQPDNKQPTPVIMMIHGGGFVGGDKRQIERTCRFFSSHGFLVFNINYRLAPEHAYPTAILDCEDAFAWVKKNAEKYGGDVSRMCVGGGSAGAYLASCLAIKKEEKQISALLLLNGCFDVDMTWHSEFPQAKLLVKCFFQEKTHDKETCYQASPLNFINEHFPRTFIGVGSKDSLLAQSHVLRDKLQEVNVDLRYHEYLNSNHGWFSWFWTKNAKQAHQDMLTWLRQTLLI
jgi:acetyl esterase/lipase